VLALAAEHQKKTTPTGTTSTNWNAVREVMNEVQKRVPAFKKDHPNGLVATSRLRSQFGERNRPHEVDSTRHRKPSWALKSSLCTSDEIARLTPLTDAVIHAENFLSQQPNSIVLRPGPNVEHWPYYDMKTTAPQATQGTKRSLDSSSDAQHDVPVKVARRRKAVKEPTDEEEEEEEDNADPSSSSPAPTATLGRRRANETRAEADLRYAETPKAVRGGAGLVQNAADDSHIDDDEVEGVSSKPSGDSASGSTPILDPFDAVLANLAAGINLPMVHTSKVNFMTDHPTVVTRWTRASDPLSAAIDLLFDQRMFELRSTEKEEGEQTPVYHGAREVEIQDLFVPQTSQVYFLAGHACRVMFHDELSQRKQLADVMLCTPSTCELCSAGELAPAADLPASHDAILPMVREADLDDMGEFGWIYSPPVPQDRPHESYRTTGRVLEVAFSGNNGRRIPAEIVEESMDLAGLDFFGSDGLWS
jgi:hypothetical protein